MERTKKSLDFSVLKSKVREAPKQGNFVTFYPHPFSDVEINHNSLRLVLSLTLLRIHQLDFHEERSLSFLTSYQAHSTRNEK